MQNICMAHTSVRRLKANAGLMILCACALVLSVHMILPHSYFPLFLQPNSQRHSVQNPLRNQLRLGPYAPVNQSQRRAPSRLGVWEILQSTQDKLSRHDAYSPPSSDLLKTDTMSDTKFGVPNRTAADMPGKLLLRTFLATRVTHNATDGDQAHAYEEFAFPEVNESSVAEVDVSRLGQLNLLYFDDSLDLPLVGRTDRYDKFESSSTSSVAGDRPAEGEGTSLHHSPRTLSALLMAFQPIISHDERIVQLFVFQTFVRACAEHRLVFFLYGGTLLGAYRHHDIIPWDDDIDVIMDGRQRHLAFRALTALPGFSLWAPLGKQWKFFWRGSPALKHMAFRWPYVDIFFFSSNGTHLHDVTLDNASDFCVPLEAVFPLQLRPFAGALQPVPCNMEAVLRVTYFPGLCVTTQYLHKLEAAAPRHLLARVACSRLHQLYPFVERRRENNSLVETVKKGQKVITQTVLPLFCED